MLFLFKKITESKLRHEMRHEMRSGKRVEIGGLSLQGTIKYIGEITSADGKWVGIELDEPKGGNNGTIQETSYFSVGSMKYCCFSSILIH